jgi:hypothetical protein
MSFSARVAAAAICAALSTFVIPAQDPKPPQKPPAPAAGEQQKPKAEEKFVIVEAAGKLQAKSKQDAEALKKQAADSHKEAMSKWEKDKKAAEAAHKPFDVPAPTAQVVMIKGSEYPSMAAAEAALKKMQDDAKAKAEAEKAKGKEPGKEPAKDPGKGAPDKGKAEAPKGK